jgi:UDP-glucose 4-epimerase
LEERADVEAIFGLDVADPHVALGRTEFVHADTRHSVINKLVRQLELDTVVHCAVAVNRRLGARALHETDVIGTMNVLAACAGDGSPVTRVVVKSSVAVYGSEPSDPSFLREEHIGRAPARNHIQADLMEMEQLVQDFAIRNRKTDVTVLRLGYRAGFREEAPLARYFRLAAVPRFLGYDPRVQLLHEEDAVEALYRAVVAAHPGVYNVAGSGVMLLSQAIELAGRRQLPILPPVWQGLAAVPLRGAAGIDLPPHIVDLLLHGMVVDCTRLREEFGWEPGFDSRAAMLDYVQQSGEQETRLRPPQPQEYELQAYLARRRRSGREVKPA